MGVGVSEPNRLCGKRSHTLNMKLLCIVRASPIRHVTGLRLGPGRTFSTRK